MHSYWFCIYFFLQIWIQRSTESTQLLLSTVSVILLRNRVKFVLWQEPVPMKTDDYLFITSPLSISLLIGTHHFIIPRSGEVSGKPTWNYVALPQSHSLNIDTTLISTLEMLFWPISKLSHSLPVWEQSPEEPALKTLTCESSRPAAFKMSLVLFNVLFLSCLPGKHFIIII